jgi:hypothetical protein
MPSIAAACFCKAEIPLVSSSMLMPKNGVTIRLDENLGSGPFRSVYYPPEIVAKCDAPNQAENFDRGARAFRAVPKSAVLKQEAKAKRRKKRIPHASR